MAECLGQCPKCKSSNIDYGVGEIEDAGVCYEATCNDCGCEFKEWYDLVYSASIIDEE